MTASGYVAATALAVASNSRPLDASGDRELLAELLQAQLAVRRDAANVNQGITAVHWSVTTSGTAAGGGSPRSTRRPRLLRRSPPSVPAGRP